MIDGYKQRVSDFSNEDLLDEVRRLSVLAEIHGDLPELGVLSLITMAELIAREMYAPDGVESWAAKAFYERGSGKGPEVSITEFMQLTQTWRRKHRENSD